MKKAAKKKPVKAKAAPGKARATKVGKSTPQAAAPAAGPFYLTLEASCTLRESADLQFSLVAARGDPLVVDGAAVQRIDTAGLQLLAALARRQQSAGRRLEWKAASDELRQCSARLGLDEALGLAVAGEAP
jgi:phospholipid transport system transporter-binding protein